MYRTLGLAGVPGQESLASLRTFGPNRKRHRKHLWNTGRAGLNRSSEGLSERLGEFHRVPLEDQGRSSQSKGLRDTGLRLLRLWSSGFLITSCVASISMDQGAHSQDAAGMLHWRLLLQENCELMLWEEAEWMLNLLQVYISFATLALTTYSDLTSDRILRLAFWQDTLVLWLVLLTDAWLDTSHTAPIISHSNGYSASYNKITGHIWNSRNSLWDDEWHGSSWGHGSLLVKIFVQLLTQRKLRKTGKLLRVDRIPITIWVVSGVNNFYVTFHLLYEQFGCSRL